MSKKKNLKKKVKRQAPVIESLEPRIMMSADLPGLDTLDIAPDDPLDVDLDRILAQAEEAFLTAQNDVDTGTAESVQEVAAVVPTDEPEVLLPSSELPEDSRRELIIVDPSVPDYELLLAGVSAVGDEDTRLDVIMLDPYRSGIDQISEILASRSNLDAIHLISHGSDGTIQMGGDSIDLALVQREANTFRAWGEALSRDGDILIYGCDLAAKSAGEALVDTLARLTVADVAASADLTGHASLGGNWELEYRAGLIEADVAIDAATQAAWQGSLEQTLWLSTDSNVAGPGADGLPGGWTEGQVLNFGGPDLAHGAATDGDLSLVVDFDTFTTDAVDVGAMHFVSRDITVGGGANTFDLKAGDVLVSFLQDETILAAYSSTGSNMPVDDQDLLVFRPTAFNDYSSGSFTILLDDVVADDLKGVTLIEQNTNIGGTDVAAGSFLIVAEASGTTSIDLFEPTGVGSGTTTGSTTPFIDLSNLGIDANRLRGIEVVEAATTVGGQALAEGSLLVTLNVDDNVSGVGGNNLLVDMNDVFVLNLTSTGIGTTAGTATMFVDGSLVGLDNNLSQENPYALALYNYSQLTVDTTSDVSDGDTSSIENLLLNKGADGKISLREAILAANATTNGDVADVVNFNITDPLVGGAHTIRVGNLADGANGALPTITDALVIDGSTDADFAGTPIIELDGNAAGTGDVAAGRRVILPWGEVGFNVADLNPDGETLMKRSLEWASGNVPAGNLLFVVQDSVSLLPEDLAKKTLMEGWGYTVNVIDVNDSQVAFDAAIAVNEVAFITKDIASGDLGQKLRNAPIGVVSEELAVTDAEFGLNSSHGWDAGVSDLTIDDNSHYITAPFAIAPLTVFDAPQELQYVTGVQAADLQTLGSTTSGASLVIMEAGGQLYDGNSVDGLHITAGNSTIRGLVINGFGDSAIEIGTGSNNVIQGNYIGTDVAGTGDPGNGPVGSGIVVYGGSSGNLIGGTGAGDQSIIANQVYDGVYLNDDAGTGNTILGNSTHNNGGMGIDLVESGPVYGVTANDVGDGDTGANNLQNFPVITQADLAGTDLTLSGTLDTDGLTTQYRIEFFGIASGNEDPTNGEGRYYLGNTKVTTDGSGDGAFSNVTLSGVTLSLGDYVTATATRIDNPAQVGIDDALAYGSTSEFAQNVAMADSNAAPTDLYATSASQGGVALNNDGGNDAYFVADDGGGLLGGLTTLTVEASFSVDTPAADNTVLLSYADGANDEELALFLKNDGSIWLHVHSNGSSGQLTANQYPELFDGKVHHVGVSWDSGSGAVAFYVDGKAVESFAGYQTGQSITGTGELVFGQDQDSVLGGWNPIDVFSGALYDVRIFNDVRTPVEIAAAYDQTLPGTEPGMIANWRFEDLSAGGVVSEAVSGNNLTLAHVGTGGGFTTSTPSLTLAVAENAAGTTVVGTLAAVDPNTGETFTYALLNDAGGRFDIAAGTGVITVQNGATLDYESATSHDITVEVTDSGGLTYSEVMTVQVVNEQPTISASGAAQVDEGTAFTLNLSATEDVSSWTINWGDGTIQTILGSPASVDHTYTAGHATYNILASATDADGVVFENDLLVTSAFTGSMFRYEPTTGFFVNEFGTGDTVHTAMSVVGPDGRLYVTGLTSDDVECYNAETGAWIETFVTSNSGGLDRAGDLAFGPDGNLYVASTWTNQILKYSAVDGSPMGVFIDTSLDGVVDPLGLVFHTDGSLYVSSSGTHEVMQYDAVTGTFQGEFVSNLDNGGLNTPNLMTFGPDGNLYVTSEMSHKVLRFNGGDGSFMDEFVDNAGGHLNRPVSLEFGPDGNLYVTSGVGDRVVRYDGSTGAYIDTYVTAGSGGLDGANGLTFVPSHQVTVNGAPVLQNNALTISEGAGMYLTSSEISAVDPDAAPAAITFTISGLAGGSFINTASGLTVASFTQADIDAGNIYFRHDGGEAAPAYNVAVSDGSLGAGPVAATITFTNVNDAPVNHLTPQPETVASSSIDGVTDIHAADLNGDGDIDLVSSSYGDDRIVWYENDGAGNLTAIDVATGVLGAREVFVADVDGDGHMDILSAAYEQESVVWYENDGAVGTPTFTAHTIALGEGQASTVYATDLDNDGDTDVLVGYQDTDEVVWYENDGLSFTRNVITNLTNGVKSVVAGDLDGDGDVDVAAVSYVGDTVDWFENDGAVDPAFSRHSVTTTLLGQMSMEIADVDGDGNNDLVVASYFDGKIAWYQNDGGPVVPTFSENIVSTSAAGARDVEVADLDGDGDADIVAASYTENQFSWYESDGAASPSFVERAITLDAGGPRAVAVADMDGDLDLDVVGAAYTGDQVGFFENTDGSMGIQVTAEETPLTFNAANNNLISISDVDAGVGEMKVRLEITNGTLSLSGVVGLTLDVGAGTDDTVVEFRGSLLDINNALDGMVFTPTQDYVGNASIRILTDDQGNSGTGSALTDDDTINISVTPVNDDPVIISDGGGATASVNVAEAAKLVTTVVSSDVDGGAPTYSISGGNDQLLFDIDPVTGELTFKTLPDFENPTDTGTDNVYQVQVTVNDGNSGTDVQMINVTVTNRAPIANPDGPSSWFDETDGGAGYGSFGELVSAYDAFIGTTEQTVDLESLADATVLSNQFSVSHGVTFSNAGVGASGIYTEGTAWIENITGYDGSWAPDGSKVYLKMGNDVPGTPFTIEFDTPVAKVGALIGMGKEGTNHSAIVSLYDSGGGLIDQQTLDAELWDATGTDQNYETLFGARYDTAIISKIEILNASNVNYANALIFDQLTWSHTPDAGYVFDASAAVPLVTGNVLANDVDPAGGTLTFVGFTQPANGSVAYNGDGTFTYTSDPGYTGVDTFNYTVSDDDGLTDIATVAIQVSNAAPTISSDGGGANAALNVSENTTGVTTVTANDPDGHTPTFSITGGVDSALFDIDANSGDLTFKMAPDYENPGDTGTNNVYDVQVTAADGHGGFDTQTISITVTDSNDAPVARPDGVHLSFDGNDFVQIADHASLQMTNKVTMEAWINPTGTGTGSQLILNKEGEYELGIIADTGEIIFAIADSGNTWAWHYTGQFVTTGEWSHIAVAYDGVAGEAKTYINGQLVDTYAQSGVIGDAYPTFNDLTIGGRGNDAFERFEGRIDEVRVWSTTRTPGEIQSSMDGQLSGAEIGLAGNWRLDEAAGGAVLDQSAFGNDGVLGGSEGAAATPSYQGYITDQSTVLNIAAGAGVLANDLDDDGDGLTVTNLDTTGMLGNLVLNTADGSFSYDPNGAFDYLDVGEQATETFTYTANDGSLDSNTVTATITIMGVEDAPVITATNTGTVAEDGTLIANGTLAITDIDTNDNPIDFPDEASILGDSGFGDFQLVGGTWTYTLNNAHASVQALDAGQSLTDTHTFTASDGTSTQLVTVTINGAEDAPTLDNAIVDQVATEDVAFSFTFASNTFGDLDTSDSFSFAATLSDGITPLPAWLSFVDNGDGTGTFSGTPSNPDVGSISVMVTADDGSSTVSDMFDITVNNANDPPVFGGTNTGSVTEDIDPDVDTLLETSGVLTIADPDAGESSFQAATIGGTYGSLTIDVAGNWSYEADNTQAAIQALDAGQSVNDVLTVSAFDGTTHNVTITINGAEDAPIITATSAGTVAEDGTLTANGTLAITDVDTNDNPIDFPDEASTLGDSGFGDFQLVGGTWTYTLNNAHASVQALDVGQSLTDAHTFTASDGTSTQLVTITINGAEDAPIITATSAGTVAEDGTLTANGTLAITDVDTNDNPIDFPDEASTLGDNGYGDFQLVGGTWTYTLNNASPVVQALDAGDAVSDTHTFTASDGTSTQVVTITITGTEDTPVIGGVSTGAVTEDVDPDLDTLLEAAGTLTITDADAGESNFVAGSVAGSHGNLIIDASGNWDYEADNTQATIQQLDAGESVNDILTVTTADGTSHNVTVTINGGEDAPLIGGVMAGAVVKDGTLVANGALSITDVDTSDNPVSFPDAASTPGDNGYGDFQLTAGSWSYTLNNGHAAVQALGAGGSLTDTHIFTASDGSTQLVSIAIAGAAETVPSPVAEPPPPAPTPEPPPIEPPPEPEEDPIDPPVEEEPDPEEPLPAGRTDPSAGEAETGDPLVDGQNSVLLKPLEPSEVFLSVIADARPDDAPGIERISAPVAKPDAASAQTFLQELKSFWQEESTTSSVEISEVRFNQQFWDGLDKMASDLDESVEEQDKQMLLSAEAAAGVGVSLTAGFVSWALRAGSMAASFLAAMPTWRHFDPMPVLVEDKKKKDGIAGEPDDESESSQKQEENSLDDLFDR